MDTWRRLPTWGKWGVMGAAFVAIVGISAALEGEEEPRVAANTTTQHEAERNRKPKPEFEPSLEEAEKQVKDELTPDLIVEVMEATDPGTIREMCEGVKLIGPELALAGFKRGYKPKENEPSAADVFGAVLVRC